MNKGDENVKQNQQMILKLAREFNDTIKHVFSVPHSDTNFEEEEIELEEEELFYEEEEETINFTQEALIIISEITKLQNEVHLELSNLPKKATKASNSTKTVLESIVRQLEIYKHRAEHMI